MDWIQHLNNAIAYMEEHMTGEIDYIQLAKTACCSPFHFQRMFSYIAGVSLTLYIKRRKMSLAAVDLQSGEKIIDVALKYGYTSPTAFNRAFQSIHGIAPSHVKEDGAILKSYPLLSFKLIAQGVEEMEFRIEQKEAIRVLGVSTPLPNTNDYDEAFDAGAELWTAVLMGPALEELNAICNAEPGGIFGIEIAYGEPKGGVYEDLEFMIAVPSTNPKDKFLEYVIPAQTWAVFPGSSYFSETGEMEALNKRIYTEWLPTSGYELTEAPEVHFIHSTDNLLKIKSDPNNILNSKFEIWLPVKKR